MFGGPPNPAERHVCSERLLHTNRDFIRSLPRVRTGSAGNKENARTWRRSEGGLAGPPLAKAPRSHSPPGCSPHGQSLPPWRRTEAPGAGDPARLSGSCVRLRPPGPESSSLPEGPRGWSWLGHVLLGSSSRVPRFPAAMWRRTRSPRGRRGGGGRRPGRSPGAGGVQGGEGGRRSGRDPSAPRPAATALRGAQPHPRGTAPPPRGKAPEPRRTPATPGPGSETPRPSPRAALPASPARGSRPTRALARPAPQPRPITARRGRSLCLSRRRRPMGSRGGAGGLANGRPGGRGWREALQAAGICALRLETVAPAGAPRTPSYSHQDPAALLWVSDPPSAVGRSARVGREVGEGDPASRLRGAGRRLEWTWSAPGPERVRLRAAWVRFRALLCTFPRGSAETCRRRRPREGRRVPVLGRAITLCSVTPYKGILESRECVPGPEPGQGS